MPHLPTFLVHLFFTLFLGGSASCYLMYGYTFSLCAAPLSLGGVTVFRNGICNECLGFKAPQSTWFGAMSCMRRPKNCWKDLLRLLTALGFGFGPVSPFACLRSTPSYTLMVLCRIYGDLLDVVCTVPGVYLGVQKTALTVNLAYLNALMTQMVPPIIVCF